MQNPSQKSQSSSSIPHHVGSSSESGIGSGVGSGGLLGMKEQQLMNQMSSAQIVSLFYSSQDQAAKEKALQSLTSAQIASLHNIQNKSSGLGGPPPPHHHPSHHHHAASHVATAAAGLAALGLAHPPNPYPSPVRGTVSFGSFSLSFTTFLYFSLLLFTIFLYFFLDFF